MECPAAKQCQLCDRKLPSLKYLLKHIREVHANRPSFHLVCSISGCQKIFHNFSVYRNHVYAYHTEAESVVLTPSSEHDEASESQNDEAAESPTNEPVADKLFARKKAAAIWILKVQESYKITQATMDQILDDVTGFFQELLLDLFDDVKSVLADSNIDHSTITGLCELFGSESFYAKPFTGLESKHRQLQFYEKELNFVVST